MIKIYTTSSCPYCVMAKDYLKSKNIAYEEANVSNDPVARQEMIDKSGQMGVPVLDINGNIIIGFDKTGIEKAMNLK